MGSPLVIVGAGGSGREAVGIVDDINADGGDWELLGLVDDGAVDAAVMERLGVPLLGGPRCWPPSGRGSGTSSG